MTFSPIGRNVHHYGELRKGIAMIGPDWPAKLRSGNCGHARLKACLRTESQPNPPFPGANLGVALRVIAAAVEPARPALVSADEAISWPEFDRMADSLAALEAG